MAIDPKSLAIPKVQRLFPTLIASNLVGVQPMTAPTGLAFNFTNKITIYLNQTALHCKVTFKYEKDDKEVETILISYNYKGSIFSLIQGSKFSPEDARDIWNRLVKEGFVVYED